MHEELDLLGRPGDTHIPAREEAASSLSMTVHETISNS